jgi:hypothetical protein
VQQLLAAGVDFTQQSDQLRELEAFFICKVFKDRADFAIIGCRYQVRVKLECFLFKGDHEANHSAHFLIAQLFFEIQAFQKMIDILLHVDFSSTELDISEISTFPGDA